MSEKLSDPGTRPELRWLPVDALVVDRSYQRDCSPAHAQNIMRRFNWLYFQAVTVTDIGGDRYAVIDGQHRVLAARSHPNIDDIPCVVVHAPTIEEQARGFVEMNRSHKQVTPIQTHWAALAAKDEDHLALQEALKTAGACVAEYVVRVDQLPPEKTLAVGTCLKMLRNFGAAHLTETVATIRKAWPKERGGLSSWMLSAVSQALRTGGTRAEIEKYLGRRSPADIERKARYTARETGKSVAHVLGDMMAEWRGRMVA